MKSIRLFIIKFLPTREIRIIAVFIVLTSCSMIALPPLLGLAVYFSSDNYYSLISGIISGFITLFVLLLQYTYEQERRHEESRINSRGIFDVKYTKDLNTDTELLKCKVGTNVTKCDRNPAILYLILKLHGEKSIIDCYVKLDGKYNGGNYDDTALIGLVVPKQTVVVPIVKECLEIKITTLYRTFMNEIIIHKFEFKNGIENPADCEKMLCIRNGGKISEKEITKILGSEDYEVIFESQSKLFEYNKLSD